MLEPTGAHYNMRNSYQECKCGRNCVWIAFDRISIDSTFQNVGTFHETNKERRFQSVTINRLALKVEIFQGLY